MTNISTMLQMLFRYAIFIVLIIILLIIGLMFFYFNNQITYQNNKINTMFGIVSDLVQKDIQPFNIPLSCSPDPTKHTFKIPGPSPSLIDVSDSDDDSDDSDDDSDDGDDDIKEDTISVQQSQPVFTDDGINIQLLDITDISDIANATTTNDVTTNTTNDVTTNDVTTNNVTISNDVTVEPVIDMTSDVKETTVNNLPEELHGYNNNNADELNITLVHSDVKHPNGNTAAHHKSLHVNELRKMAVQLQLIQNVEAKKLKKDDLIELISKSTEGKDEAI